MDWPHKAESKSYFPPKGKETEQHTATPLLSVFSASACLKLSLSQSTLLKDPMQT